MRTNLKKIRKEKDFTQAQLAKLSNISERQYRRIESGEQTPNVEVAILIAEALNVENIKDIFPLQRQLREIEKQPNCNSAEKNNL